MYSLRSYKEQGSQLMRIPVEASNECDLYSKFASACEVIGKSLDCQSSFDRFDYNLHKFKGFDRDHFILSAYLCRICCKSLKTIRKPLCQTDTRLISIFFHLPWTDLTILSKLSFSNFNVSRVTSQLLPL